MSLQACNDRHECRRLRWHWSPLDRFPAANLRSKVLAPSVRARYFQRALWPLGRRGRCGNRYFHLADVIHGHHDALRKFPSWGSIKFHWIFRHRLVNSEELSRNSKTPSHYRQSGRSTSLCIGVSLWPVRAPWSRQSWLTQLLPGISGIICRICFTCLIPPSQQMG